MNICAVDIGTTAVKAMIVDGAGRRLAAASMSYPLNTAPGGVVEQDARAWSELTMRAVRECVKASTGDVACLCISSQGGSMAPVDGGGNPMAPAATWMDTRGGDAVTALLGKRNEQWLYKHTGRIPAQSSCIGHVLSFRGLNPAKYLTTLEFVHLQLTGRAVTDPTSAAMTGLYDIGAGFWQKEILEYCGINESSLPEILPTGAFVGTLTPGAASVMGLPAGTAVVNGGHDQYCAAAGANVLSPGDILLSAGSAWVVFGASSVPYADFGFSNGPHVRPGLYGVFSSVPTGGVALDWVRGKLLRAEDAEYETLNRETVVRMGKIPGLIVRPHFSTGLASIEGVGLHTDDYDIALATMEGVVFEARRIIERFSEVCGTRTVKLIGGAARSPSWRELVGSIIGEAILYDDADVASAGAAAIGGVAAGLWKNIEAASDTLCKCKSIPPSGKYGAYYEEKYVHYRKGSR